MIGAIKKHKRIVAAVVILILTAVIELVCNLPAIRGGYDNLDLTKYITCLLYTSDAADEL